MLRNLDNLRGDAHSAGAKFKAKLVGILFHHPTLYTDVLLDYRFDGLATIRAIEAAIFTQDELLLDVVRRMADRRRVKLTPALFAEFLRIQASLDDNLTVDTSGEPLRDIADRIITEDPIEAICRSLRGMGWTAEIVEDHDETNRVLVHVDGLDK